MRSRGLATDCYATVVRCSRVARAGRVRRGKCWSDHICNGGGRAREEAATEEEIRNKDQDRESKKRFRNKEMV